jgi:malate synthase
MGGMAAQIPIKSDAEANEQALNKVRADKLREVKAGHDGTWVAHPGLVPIAMEIFDKYMPTPNQIHILREDVNVTANDLLKVPEGEITEKGLRTNIDVGIRYLESWLRDTGCVPIYNLMEDAATAEISRAQLWQWARHRANLSDGRKITVDLFKEFLKEELNKIKIEIGEQTYNSGKYKLAEELFTQMVTSEDFPEFLTLTAYKYID